MNILRRYNSQEKNISVVENSFCNSDSIIFAIFRILSPMGILIGGSDNNPRSSPVNPMPGIQSSVLGAIQGVSGGSIVFKLWIAIGNSCDSDVIYGWPLRS